MPILASGYFSRTECIAGVVQIRSPMLSRRMKSIFIVFLWHQVLFYCSVIISLDWFVFLEFEENMTLMEG